MARKPHKPPIDLLALGRDYAQRSREAAVVAAPVKGPEPIGADFEKTIAAMLAAIKPASAAEVAADRDKRRLIPLLVDAGIALEHRASRAAVNRCPKWAASLEKVRATLAGNAGAIVVLIGPRGTGKTQIAAEVARDFAGRQLDAEDASAEAARSGRRVSVSVPALAMTYQKAARYFGRCKELYANVGTINAEVRQREIDILRGYDLVIFDELQEAADDDRRVGFGKILTDIVDLRYSAQKPTLLISNHYDEANPKDRSAIEAFLGASIVSRMNQTGGFVVCDWESFRG